MKLYREKSLQFAMQYLTETEPAVRNIFGILQQYFSILENIKLPVCIAPYTPGEAFGSAFKKWQRKNRAANKQAAEYLHEYLGYRFSINTLCGSILQIAYMGINLYSKNKVVLPELSSIIKSKRIHKISRFCVGRTVRGAPIGLIIYAGRNQYNHWDKENMSDSVNQWVFDRLATKHEIKGMEKFVEKEPAFNLNNKMIEIYSSNILFILGWNSYDNYSTDMHNLLISGEKRESE